MRSRATLFSLMGTVLVVLSSALPTSADAANSSDPCYAIDCVDVDPGDGGIGVGVIGGKPGSGGGAPPGSTPAPGGGSGVPARLFEYTYVPACPGNQVGTDALCVGATTSCPELNQIRYWVFVRTVGPPPSAWQRREGSLCYAGRPPSGPPAGGPTAPTVDEVRASVERAFQRLPLPPSRIALQPAAGPLVQLDAIFVADTPASRLFVVNALGLTVNVTAVPQRWDWSFGDGHELSSNGPGRPYPARDVTHVYQQPGVVTTSVSVTWGGSYAFGGNRYEIQGTVDVDGVAATLPVREARAQLIDGR